MKESCNAKKFMMERSKHNGSWLVMAEQFKKLKLNPLVLKKNKDQFKIYIYIYLTKQYYFIPHHASTTRMWRYRQSHICLSPIPLQNMGTP